MNLRALLDHGFSVKSVKNFSSHEGGGFTCSLTHHGKAVAEVQNHGDGGCHCWYWKGLRRDGSIQTPSKEATRAKAAYDAFRDFVEANPPHGVKGYEDADWYVSALLDHADMCRKMKTATLFRLPDDPKFSYRITKVPYSLEVKAQILRQRPDAVILNENPFA